MDNENDLNQDIEAFKNLEQFLAFKNQLESTDKFQKIEPITVKYAVVPLQVDWYVNVDTKDLWCLHLGDGSFSPAWKREYISTR